MSPPPPVAVTVPWMWVVVPGLSLTRKCPTLPAATPLPCQVPDFAFTPPADAASQSAGSAISHKSVPVSAAAQLAGGAPVRSWSFADPPVVLSIVSFCASRTPPES
jgi:hypothetical protein